MFSKCLYFNTTALARLLEREWTRAFQQFDLTPPQAFMLRAVLDQPGQSLSELASSMAISRPTATRALDGLSAKRLVERSPSVRDGREIAVHPTASARALHSELNRASAGVTARLKRLLGDQSFADAVSTIRQVRTRIE